MDLDVPKRLPKRKLTPTERFLGVPPHAPLATTPATTNSASLELHEDDVVFFNTDYLAEINHNPNNNNNNNHSSTTSTSSSFAAIPNHHHHHHSHRKGHPYASADSFGILAALPENETSATNLRRVPQLFHNHKASVSSAVSSFSSSSSSSSVYSSVRAIPAIPRPAPPWHHHDRFSSSSIFNGPMSAPVDVPILSGAALRERHGFEDDNDEEYEEEGGERVPLHEVVARKWARTPALSCSVLEGAGRTLKGRDLRTVRNAVWRQTGFID